MNELERFRQAVADGSVTDAVERAGPALDAVDARSQREQGIETAAHSVTSDPSASAAAQQAAGDVFEAISNAESARTELGYLAVGLGNGRFDRESALESIDAALSATDAVDTAASSLRATEAADDLDPILLAVAENESVAAPLGESASVDITVENSGGSVASDVTLSVESEVAVDVRPGTFDEVAGASRSTATLTVPSTATAGDYTAQVFVEWDGLVRDSLTLSVAVRSKREYVGRALDQLDDIESRVEEVLSTVRRPARPFKNRIGKIRRKLESLESDLESGKADGKKANRRLDKTQKQLNGLYGLVKSLNQVDDGVQAELRGRVEAFEGTLKTAKAAESV